MEEPAIYNERIAKLEQSLAERDNIIAEQKKAIAILKGEVNRKTDDQIRLETALTERDKSTIALFNELLDKTKKEFKVNMEFEIRMEHYISYNIQHIDRIYAGLKDLMEQREDLFIDQATVDSIINNSIPSQPYEDSYSPTSNEAADFLNAIEQILLSWKQTVKMPIPDIAAALIQASELYSNSKKPDALRQQFYIKKERLAKDLRFHLRQAGNANKWSKTRKRGLFNSLFKKPK